MLADELAPEVGRSAPIATVIGLPAGGLHPPAPAASGSVSRKVSDVSELQIWLELLNEVLELPV
jgi:hypothetical protein